MTILGYIGQAWDWCAALLKNNNYYISRTPLFMQFVDMCVYNYPDTLDVQHTSHMTVPVYLFAGLFDYVVIHVWSLTVTRFLHLWSSSDEPLHAWMNPNPRVSQVCLILSFTFRLRNLGADSMRYLRSCIGPRWSETRRLATLILLLCPALTWYCLLQALLDALELDRDRPWLSMIFVYLISTDWNLASLLSGWFIVDVRREAKTPSNTNSTRASSMKEDFKQYQLDRMVRELVKCLPILITTIITTVPFWARWSQQLIANGSRMFQRTGINRACALFEGKIVASRDGALVRMTEALHRAGGMDLWLYFCRQTLIRWIQLQTSLDIKISTDRTAIESFFGRFWRSPEKWSADTLAIAIDKPKTHRIRLICVYPAFDDNEEVICTRNWYDMEVAPRYTAISYVWGSSTRNSTILIDGVEEHTTASAKAALRGLRSVWSRRYFWIDAICIDQTSVEDKALQLSIMANIYINASKVVVWLGSDANGSLALSLARRLFVGTRLRRISIEPLQYTADIPAHAWDALRNLLQNKWFERSWVVQEVLSGDVVIRCGSGCISWSTFVMFATAMNNEQPVLDKLDIIGDVQCPSSHRDAMTIARRIKYIRAFEEFRAVYAQQGTQEHLSLLFYLVRMFRTSCRFGVTEAKDRVYALVNLCGLADHPKFRTDYRVTKDATLTKADLFTEVAHHLLTSGPDSRRLDILAHAGTGFASQTDMSSTLDIPSWVPDWSLETYPVMPLVGQDGMSEILHHPRLEGILEGIADVRSYDEVSYWGRPEREAALVKLRNMSRTLKDSTLYHATSSEAPDFSICSTGGGKILHIQGVHVDHIRALGPVFPLQSLSASPSSDTMEELKWIIDTILGWIGLILNCRPDVALSDSKPTVSEAEQIFRILLADLSYPVSDLTLSRIPLRPAPDDSMCAVALYIETLCKIRKLTADELSCNLQVREMVSSVTFKDIDAHVRMTCSGRVFGITKCGFMGLFPHGTKVEDEVCLLLGADTPFIVRQRGHQGEVHSRDTKTNVMAHDRDQMAGAVSNAPSAAGETQISDAEDQQNLRWAYELVGPAYVQGLMDGEGLTGDFQRKRYALR